MLADLLTPILGASSKQIANELFDHFGSIPMIVNASREALYCAVGQDKHIADALLAVRQLALLGWQETLAGEALKVGDKRLGGFFRQKLAYSRVERLHAVFLDAHDGFIRDECVGMGTRNSLSLCSRSLVQRSLELGASKVIIAHNHPSGCFLPSKHDRQATAEFENIARFLEIELVDHCIVAGGRVFSMRMDIEI